MRRNKIWKKEKFFRKKRELFRINWVADYLPMMANGCWRDRRPSKPRINSRHWKRNFSFPFEDRRYGSLMKFADRLPGEWDLFIGRCHFVESIIARMAIGWEKFRYLSLFEFNYSNLTYNNIARLFLTTRLFRAKEIQSSNPFFYLRLLLLSLY